MRHIEMHFSAEEQCDASRFTSGQEFMNALGYLSLWALDSYPTLSLYLLPDGEIVARYANESGGRYEIHGLPSDDGNYHFHS